LPRKAGTEAADELMDANDAQKAAIQRAITAVSLGKLGVAEAFAAITSAVAMPSRETMLAEVFRLEQEGHRASRLLVTHVNVKRTTNANN
jgi:hypothetical protein